MKNSKKLVVSVLAVTVLGGASAFAENRHSGETREGGARDRSGVIERRGNPAAREQTRQRSRVSEGRSEGGSISRERSGRRDSNPASADQQDRGNFPRSERSASSRREGSRSGSYGWRDGRSSRNGYRGSNRSYSNTRGSRQPHYVSGRISRYERYGNGYRLWLGGSRYPFFVPFDRWDRNRFRPGISIRLGGFYNPLGFYDYYDPYYYGSSYGDRYSYGRYGSYGRGNTYASLRGTVESVDSRRDTFVIRNEATGSFVTTVLRSRSRDADLRPGDYVEISGEWTRSGLFEAYDVDYLDQAGYGR